MDWKFEARNISINHMTLLFQFKHRLSEEMAGTTRHLPGVEGLSSDDWIAVDLGIHILIIFNFKSCCTS